MARTLIDFNTENSLLVVKISTGWVDDDKKRIWFMNRELKHPDLKNCFVREIVIGPIALWFSTLE